MPLRWPLPERPTRFRHAPERPTTRRGRRDCVPPGGLRASLGRADPGRSRASTLLRPSCLRRARRNCCGRGARGVCTSLRSDRPLNSSRRTRALADGGTRGSTRPRCCHRRRSGRHDRRRDRSRGRSDDRGLGGRRRRWHDIAGWKERRRVDVAIGGRRHPDAEVHVGGRPLRLAALAGDTHRIALGNGCALRDRGLTEVRERDGVPVCLDRDRPARGRHDTDERHDSGRRSAHRLSGRPGDVDAPVLAGGVRVRAERVGTEHVSTQRPRPGRRLWG